ncbi:hypothetical protein BJX61DRAFT_532180 [Aspergillus egyptiacus]|nr:hypothetical protein BJX61DRAFT_532180 [Aspergillus egyptiacus]
MSDEQDALDALEKEASDFVKLQYRKKSLLIHPDKTKNPAAPDAFDRLKKAQSALMDEKQRTYLDECIADARRLLIREHKYTLDSPELKTEEFKKEWRAKTVHVLLEEEARRRRQAKAKLQEEGRERRKEEEEIDERKRKREQEKAWEDSREQRIGSWRDWQKGQKKDGEKKKKKMKISSTPQLNSSQPEDLPSAHADSLSSVIKACHEKVQAFLSKPYPQDSFEAAAQRQTRISLDVIAQAVCRFKLTELALSYNGGKDCLVLLIILLAGLHPLLPLEEGQAQELQQFSEIPAIYSRPGNSFPEMEEFVDWSSRVYHLDMARYTMDKSTTLKSSFEDYLARHPSVKAIFVGTRRTDPYSENLTHFDRTDGGWPDFVRIHPVIDWHYAEIWAFIRALRLQYCTLYDKGYTSLGSMSDTLPNPELLVEGHRHTTEANMHHKPAYELINDADERKGRIKGR